MSLSKTLIGLFSLLFLLSGPRMADDVSAKERARLERKVVQYYQYSQQATMTGANLSANEHASKAYAIGQRIFDPKSKNMGMLILNAAKMTVLAYKEKAAIGFLDKNMPVLIEIFGENSEEHLGAQLYYGHAHLKKKMGKAKKIYQQILAVIEEKDGKTSLNYGRHQFDIAHQVLVMTGNPYGSSMLKKARATFEAIDSAEAKKALETLLFTEGKYHLAKKRYTTAQKTFEDIVAKLDAENPKSPTILNALAFLVVTCEERHKREEATQYALEIGRRSALYNLPYSKPLYSPRGKYPKNYSRKKGKVTVSFLIDEQGYVIDPVVTSSDLPKAFEKATIETVKNFRYAPKFQNGKAVKTAGRNYTMGWNIDE